MTDMSNGSKGPINPTAMRVAVYLLLALIVVAVFGRSIGYGFINLDDPAFVTQNGYVNGGFTWRGLQWAFQGPHWSWHPVTWFSHMLDCQVFGIDQAEDAATFSLAGAAGHHFVNVLLHAINVMLLLFVLHRLTDRFWPSAVVALLFAVHPLRVEAVVWISERKELLCLGFGLATIAAYTSYVRRPHWGSYLLAIVFYAFCLMSKAMLVTLPFVLLLLDYWPLKRLQLKHNGLLNQKTDPKADSKPNLNTESNDSESTASPDLKRILAEKLPFLILAIGCVAMTVWAAKSWHPGAIASVENHTIVDRFANALVSYARYLQKMVWPQNLAVVYPLRNWPIWIVGLSAAVMLSISALTILALKKRPYLLIGWLWFLGTLVPVIGLVQAGDQAMADRFTYVPMIGVLIALVWLVADSVKAKNARGLLATVVFAIAVSWGGLSWWQAGHWQSSEGLFRRTLDKTENNPIAHVMLGQTLAQQGDMASALEQYQKAFEIRPEDARVRSARGIGLLSVGQFDGAIIDLQRAVELDPLHFESHVALGKALGAKGKHQLAARHMLIAIGLVPNFVDGYYLLGLSYQRDGSPEQAAEFYVKTIRLNSSHLPALLGLARLRATSPLNTVRDGTSALKLAKHACGLTGNKNASALDVLAAAYAELGRFADAIRLARKALSTAKAQGQTDLAARIQTHLNAYKQGKRLRLK
jgi:tetratricopeptide (TPR) repeat protein